MRPESEIAALVALLRAPSRPLAEYAALLEAGDSATALADEDFGLLAHEHVEQARQEITRWQARGIQPLTINDSAYPANLRVVHDHPPLIFIAGQLLAEDARSVAVIGTRRPSDDGTNAARAVAEALVEHGFAVVSGLAAGIDTAAHTAALATGGRTVAVIGTGLEHAYPPENAALQRRIAEEGAVISQFWPEASPTRQSFPQRNAVMSGIALANVIVEAGPRSGARTQARLALAHGRPIVLIDTLLEQEWARELAARPGTWIARSPAEVPTIVERLASVGSLTE
jgi:DNA processing protein